MVHKCVVHGCQSRSDDPIKRKFLTIPAVRVTEGDWTKELSKQRRMLWIARIHRKGFELDVYKPILMEQTFTTDDIQV